jgi:hypothetical protein
MMLSQQSLIATGSRAQHHPQNLIPIALPVLKTTQNPMISPFLLPSPTTTSTIPTNDTTFNGGT